LFTSLIRGYNNDNNNVDELFLGDAKIKMVQK